MNGVPCSRAHALELQVESVGLDEVRAAEEREARRAREVAHLPSLQRGCRRLDLEPGDVCVNLAVLFTNGARAQALRAALALSRFDGESPAVVPANERRAFELAFAEERALVRTAAFEGLETTGRPHDHEIASVRARRVRSRTGELGCTGDAYPGTGRSGHGAKVRGRSMLV